MDGHNVRIEYRGAGGRVEVLPRLADELVRLPSNVIVTAAEPALRAARGATNRIPIVMVSFDYDPVTEGLVNSLNRPGGNITGIYARQTEMVGKRLELLKELVPGLRRIAVFWDSSGKGSSRRPNAQRTHWACAFTSWNCVLLTTSRRPFPLR